MTHGAVVQKKYGMQVWFAQCSEHGAVGPDALSWRDADRTALQHNYQHRLPRKEGAPMRTKEQIATEIELAQQRLDRLADELAKVEALPAEPIDGSVITFTVQFDRYGIAYSYAAIRLSKLWYVTGKQTSGVAWSKLLDLMNEDCRVRDGERRLSFTLMESSQVVKAAKS